MAGKKVLFITPPYHCGVVEVAGSWVPLTFVYLAGAIREVGFEPIIYDAMTKRHGFNEIEKTITDIMPDYVATTAITSTITDAIDVLMIAKKVNPDIITIIGGVHPSFLYHEVLRNGNVDYVVREEGEETLKELLLSLNNGGNLENVSGIAYRIGHRFLATKPRPFIHDLDSLKPAWDLIEWKDYRYFVIPNSRLGAISTSRGCNHSCTFCSQQKFWHQSWRGRSPENVVMEIEHLVKKYGVNVFLIPDEYPTQDKKRWERLLDLLIERELDIYLLMETRAEDIIRDRDILHKYKKAGVVHIYIGIEATEQKTLDLIKKDIKAETGIEAIRLIHEHDMISETSFILGFPHETKESIKNTLALSKIYNPDFAHFLALAPWPYADMFKELTPHIVTKDYRKYNLIDPVIKPINMTLEDIDKAIIDCYQSFYMDKMKEMLILPNGFKKSYIMRSMKLIMKSSFIVDKLGVIGKIPPKMDSLSKMFDKEMPDVEPEKPSFEHIVSRSILINAPVSEVFEFVSNPVNWPRFINRLTEIRNVSTNEISLGTTFDWTYNIRGINIRGKGKVTEFQKNKRLVLQMHRFFPLKEALYFRDKGNETVMTIEIGHGLNNKVLDILFKLAMKSVNMIEADVVLQKIKFICEKEQPRQIEYKIAIQ